MNVLVAYQSRTGNTKKIAEAIYGEIPEARELKRLEEVDGLAGYDLAFIGFPIERFGPTTEVCEFLAKHGQGRRVAFFITHAADEGFPMVEGWLAKTREAATGADVVGLFHCQGEMSEALANAMAAMDNPMMREFAAARPMTLGQPDTARVERARAFAREVLQNLS